MRSHLMFYSVHLAMIEYASAYNLVADYSSSSFFDKWDFYGNYDNLTSGDVIWQDRANATSEKLAFVNAAGNAIIKVDNTTNVPYNIKRDSVRITTHDAFEVGTLFIADFLHLPFGCSVWPAFWTKGVDWPDGGEIDILEGVNLMNQNQMALHTRPGCMNVPPAPGAQLGQTGNLNCSQDAGCTVVETQPNSFGQPFNSNGGGVYATQFDVDGIYIWFWTRSRIPASITNLAANPSNSISSLSDWGTPSASYPSNPKDSNTNCNISEYFDAQNLVLDITLCGNFAGAPNIYTPQCGGSGPTGLCYNDNVIGNGTNYDEAYFEVQYVRVYSDVATLTSGSSPGGTSSPTPTGGATSSSDTPQTLTQGLLYLGLVLFAVGVSYG